MALSALMGRRITLLAYTKPSSVRACTETGRTSQGKELYIVEIDDDNLFSSIQILPDTDESVRFEGERREPN